MLRMGRMNAYARKINHIHDGWKNSNRPWGYVFLRCRRTAIYRKMGTKLKINSLNIKV